MKKYLLLTLSLIFALSFSIPASAVTERVTTADALEILKIVSGIIELTPEQEAFYDINGDGVVDTADAVAALRIAAGFYDNYENEHDKDKGITEHEKDEEKDKNKRPFENHETEEMQHDELI